MTSDVYEAHSQCCYYAKGFTKIISFNPHKSYALALCAHFTDEETEDRGHIASN